MLRPGERCHHDLRLREIAWQQRLTSALLRMSSPILGERSVSNNTAVVVARLLGQMRMAVGASGATGALRQLTEDIDALSRYFECEEVSVEVMLDPSLSAEQRDRVLAWATGRSHGDAEMKSDAPAEWRIDESGDDRGVRVVVRSLSAIHRTSAVTACEPFCLVAATGHALSRYASELEQVCRERPFVLLASEVVAPDRSASPLITGGAWLVEAVAIARLPRAPLI